MKTFTKTNDFIIISEIKQLIELNASNLNSFVILYLFLKFEFNKQFFVKKVNFFFLT
jgi:hypothetical protein